MANETGFAPDYVKEAGEYAPGSFLSSAFSNRMFGPTNEDVLLEHQYKVITELAEKDPCVIVGRCADYILQNNADCLKVFIHADMKFRAALPNSLAIFSAACRIICRAAHWLKLYADESGYVSDRRYSQPCRRIF